MRGSGSSQQGKDAFGMVDMKWTRRPIVGGVKQRHENLARLRSIERRLKKKPGNYEFFILAREAIFRLRRTAREQPGASKKIIESIALELRSRRFDPHEFDRAALLDDLLRECMNSLEPEIDSIF